MTTKTTTYAATTTESTNGADAQINQQPELEPAGGPQRPVAGQGGDFSTPALVAAHEALWLELSDSGWAVDEIAGFVRVSKRRIEQGLTQARLQAQEARKRESRKRDLVRKQEGEAGAGSGDRQWEDPRRLPRLVPLFPIGPFTPRSTCGHHGTIRQGSVFCCMICHQSGMDGHPGLKRNPKTDPRPEPKPPAARREDGSRETRKQRRRRLRVN
ncbi:MAG: hypothetical protein ACP5XB_26620 [Isosphaeraceae bacterium]